MKTRIKDETILYKDETLNKDETFINIVEFNSTSR